MNNDGTTVTRAQLREELARYPTREELREELARYPTRDELREELREELARYPTREEFREELKAELAPLATKEELGQLVQAVVEQHNVLLAKIVQISADLLQEIGRTARAAAEEHRRELGVLDDRYRDLPERVTMLERDLEEHRRDGALHPRRRRPTRQR